MRKTLLTTAVVWFGILPVGSAAAHDFFLIPDKFVETSGRPSIVHATSSSDFPAPKVASPRTRIADARAIVSGRPVTVEVQGPTANSLRLAVASDTPGMGLVAVQTIWGESNWKPDMVDTYLDEHPFKRAEVEMVRHMLPKGQALQIRSRRLAKTLICFRECTLPAPSAAGLEVEFIPEFGADKASPKRAQLLRNGRPLVAHPVLIKAAQSEPQKVLTDGAGWAQLPAGLSGPVMLVAATLDPPVQKGGRFTANNASLTFNIEPAARSSGGE